MPRILISDPFGYSYNIASSNSDTVATWLVEIMERLASPNPAVNEIRVRIDPMWVGPEIGGHWDWPPDASLTFWSTVAGATPADNAIALGEQLIDWGKARKSDGM